MIFRKNWLCVQIKRTNDSALKNQALFGVLALTALISLSACNKQARTDDKVGRALALVKVNDVEITMLRSSDDLAPVDVRSIATKEAVDRQFLEMLIDRQLLQEEAMRNMLDRDPQVIQAIDRAKAQILAQAYLQRKFAAINAVSKAEVDAYFRGHPELFAERKLFFMKELVVATKDFNVQLKSRLDSAKSIEQVAAWLDENKVQYERVKLSRSTADLAPEMSAKLQTMRRNQLFVVKAGEYSMLDFLYDVKPSPVTAEEAAPQIALYLRNRRRKEVGDVELARLRASAKVEYLNKMQAVPATSAAVKLAGSATTIQVEDGLPGFK